MVADARVSITGEGANTRMTTMGPVGRFFDTLMWAAVIGSVAATLWSAWQKFSLPVPPQPVQLTLTGAGAFLVNFACAFLLGRFRHHSGSLTRAAFLSARNDVLANVAIIAAGLLTAATLSVWPDLLVGLGIAALNADASRQVLAAARKERQEARP